MPPSPDLPVMDGTSAWKQGGEPHRTPCARHGLIERVRGASGTGRMVEGVVGIVRGRGWPIGPSCSVRLFLWLCVFFVLHFLRIWFRFRVMSQDSDTKLEGQNLDLGPDETDPNSADWPQIKRHDVAPTVIV